MNKKKKKRTQHNTQFHYGWLRSCCCRLMVLCRRRWATVLHFHIPYIRSVQCINTYIYTNCEKEWKKKSSNNSWPKEFARTATSPTPATQNSFSPSKWLCMKVIELLFLSFNRFEYVSTFVIHAHSDTDFWCTLCWIPCVSNQMGKKAGNLHVIWLCVYVFIDEKQTKKRVSKIRSSSPSSSPTDHDDDDIA